jgi:hypothetical protein
MTKLKNIILATLLLCSVAGSCLSTPPGRSQRPGNRLFFGPAYGFYNINKNHARDATPKMSALAGFRKEIAIDREYRTFFLFGADYFFHGLNYKSYYFKPDSLQLYNKTFSYNYSLFIHEVNLPLQVKYSFTRENNSMFSPYVMVGYHLRYLLPGILNVSQNGTRVESGKADLIFKNPFLDKHMNSFVSVTAGWQKNSFNSSRSSFFIELNFRYGFSPCYFEKTYAPASLYTSGMHLALLIGLKI